MQQMQEIIMNQSASMQDTQKVVEEVIAQIGQIKESTGHLESSRNEVLQAVSELSEIAQGNVDSTKKTYDETEEVVDTFKQVYVSAEQLREIADELVSSIDYFKMQ